MHHCILFTCTRASCDTYIGYWLTYCDFIFLTPRICIHASCDNHVVGLPYFDAMCFSSHIHTCIYYNSNTHTHTQLRTFT